MCKSDTIVQQTSSDNKKYNVMNLKYNDIDKFKVIKVAIVQEDSAQFNFVDEDVQIINASGTKYCSALENRNND